jgi:putative lipoprotein
MRGLALLFTLHFGGEPAGRDPWFSPDKAKHFFMSAFVQSASFSALRLAGASRTGSLVGASAASLSVGVGKELYDKKFGGDPSLKDLTWDGAGITAASLLLARTEP